MSVIGSNILAGASGQGGGYNLTKSLRFRSSASAYLNRTPAGSPTSTQKFTQSYWVKRGTLSTTQYIYNCEPSDWVRAYIFSDNILYFDIRVSGTNYSVGTTQVFRDPSAWYHIVVSVDTTQATAANRVLIYVNGVQAPTNTPTIPQNSATVANSANPNFIGAYKTPNQYFDGYLAEVNFVDGQALTPSSFGETSTTTGVWIPKKYTGTYGTNGFYLPFTNTTSTSTLGNDFSGNSNTWTVNNISLTSGSTYDSMNDVPTLTSATQANYATLNPLDKVLSPTVINGNLSATVGDNTEIRGTIYVSSGKWYWEIIPTTMTFSMIGIGIGGSGLSWGTTGVSYYGFNGNKYLNGTASSYGASYTNNDVIGVALDLDNLQITFYKNNTSQGTITGLTAGSYAPALSAAGNSSVYNTNFGQRPFSYTPPTGFVALNTFNLPTPTIGATASTTANKYMDVTLINANQSTQVIVNAGGFQPDMVWLKSRSNANNHTLYDALRGVNNPLYPNLTNAEGSGSALLTSFNSNGFTLGANENSNDQAGETSVGWQWRASNVAGVTNTAGSITSTVSANTTAGFSIVTYTGTGSNATVGHGLGVAPSMVIVKDRDTTDVWMVQHISLGATKYIILNRTDSEGTLSTAWNNTAPTSSVFSIGTLLDVNRNAFKYVAYCFAQVAGYSAMGSYTGNGSSDGTFIHLGFRPRFVLIKCSSSADNWSINDSSRDTYNAWNARLYPDLSNAENAGGAGDFLSNGFKLRSASQNTNGATYIYAAFAESPFKYANAR